MNLDDLPWIDVTEDENGVSVQIAKKFLPDNPVILEAGMCVGEDTRRFKKVWPNSTIYGFEPHSQNYLKCKKVESELKNVFVYNVALSNDDQRGMRKFYESTIAPAASSLLEDNLATVKEVYNPAPQDSNSGYEDRDSTAWVTTFYLWNGEEKYNIDYMWLDAEGSELHIIEGMGKYLDDVKVISTEINFQEFRKGTVLFPDLYQYLTDKGFKLEAVWGNHKWQGGAVFVK